MKDRDGRRRGGRGGRDAPEDAQVLEAGQVVEVAQLLHVVVGEDERLDVGQTLVEPRLDPPAHTHSRVHQRDPPPRGPSVPARHIPRGRCALPVLSCALPDLQSALPELKKKKKKNVCCFCVFRQPMQNACKMLADVCPCFHRSATKLCPDLVSFTRKSLRSILCPILCRLRTKLCPNFGRSRARLCPISFALCPFPNLAGTQSPLQGPVLGVVKYCQHL